MIGITLGDPGGIGPEIILKAFSSESSLDHSKYILFGSRSVIEKEKKLLGLDLEIPDHEEDQKGSSPYISLYDTSESLQDLKKGVPSSENGIASFQYFEEGVKAAQKGIIRSLVTGPISKHSWSLAGIHWAGHTDYLAHFYPQVIMSFWSERIKVALFTHHIPLSKAVQKIKKEDLLEFFLSLYDYLNRAQIKKFQLLAAGLNPHAGEQGLLGSEEIQEIFPAVEAAQKMGIPISGPFPPDIIFRKAMDQHDKIVIALYHDQGLIPFKLEEFETGVNITLGLPFLRTSPDHGTAFDIAGKGIASPESMIEAIQWAHKLSNTL
jgi:4-hydroxythreonine-4-phosphate dehydrogenase